uniref:RRM domain-containing protein n=1 Tax=Heterorhabditis bacteriophora TaxID=37862 RepID=A0A1I7WFF0_HETBA
MANGKGDFRISTFMVNLLDLESLFVVDYLLTLVLFRCISLFAFYVISLDDCDQFICSPRINLSKSQVLTSHKSLYNPQDLRPEFSTGSPLETSSKFIIRQIAPGIFSSRKTNISTEINYSLFVVCYDFPDFLRFVFMVTVNPIFNKVIFINTLSDATLNGGRVRFVTAEIYAAVEAFREVSDRIVAGQYLLSKVSNLIANVYKICLHEIFSFIIRIFINSEVTQLICIIVVLKIMAGHELTNILKHRLTVEMRTMMSPRHVPSAIYAVRDISKISDFTVMCFISHVLFFV